MRVTLNEDSQTVWQREKLEHLRYEYDLTPDDLVIDIGAYRGEWAEEIYKRYRCRIICIEPTEYIRGFKYGEVINKAAGTRDGKIRFGGQAYYTSAHEDPTHEYECFHINSLLAVLPEIALVKINIEGAEYDLIEHVYRGGLLPRIKNLQMQFHLIEGEDSTMRYEAVSELLSETHSITWEYPFCWENWRRDRDDRLNFMLASKSHA